LWLSTSNLTGMGQAPLLFTPSRGSYTEIRIY